MGKKMFKCHMCEEIMEGKPRMRVALIGFVWEPSLYADPGELLDLCEACQYALLKSYEKAKAERLEAVYDKQKEAFLRIKMSGLRREWSRTGGSAKPPRLPPAQEIHQDRARWNYNNGEKQQSWRF